MTDESTPAAPAKEPEGGKEPEHKTEPDKTFTQDDVDRVVRERLERERKKYDGFDDLKAKAAQYDELAEKDKTESEKLAAKVAKSEKEKAEAQARLLRYEVAAEKEVPAKLVPLLTATSREDLEAQATLILENAKPATPDFDGGAREPAPEPTTPDEAHKNFLLDVISGKQTQ